ncbi:kinase, pfkB family protein [Lysobacter enzymogenes]|uniref:Kinase, pfkB family protein n=1 Tax=Lysobacter enzymogenes TaxID=69 RepID=A0A0S2DH21_LYSEN|nr:carbohydrate kinase family protein [Lysobacter enzymogenes]ALN57883.1 kinase, pfkB family protein [Lysobacter enzymogenes]QCW26400.1 carbohydrate kinase family protein [Lysobacter enzymogenes]
MTDAPARFDPLPDPPPASPADPPRFNIVGDVSVDLVLGTLDGWPKIGTERLLPRSELRAGGSAANSALAARHLGLSPHLIGAIGDDDLAQWLLLQLSGIRVDLQTCSSDTTMSVGLLHTGGERTFFTSCGHLQHLAPEFVLRHLPPAAPGSIALFTAPFLLPGLRERFAALLAQAAARGYQIALDTGWPPEGWTPQVHREVAGWLAYCDHLLVNELETMSIAGDDSLESAVRRVAGLLKPGAHLIVKLGAAGALGHVDGRSTLHATQAAADVFDTVGAGDSFNTGYLAARLNRAGLSDALAAGCRTASAILPRFPRKRIAAGELAHCLQPQP